MTIVCFFVARFPVPRFVGRAGARQGCTRGFYRHALRAGAQKKPRPA
jgi:hypothetical protein